MKDYCCKAMKHAIEEGYIGWPITYTDDMKMVRLTPFIAHCEHEMPVFKLNLCPWCGAEVRTEIEGKAEAV